MKLNKDQITQNSSDKCSITNTLSPLRKHICQFPRCDAVVVAVKTVLTWSRFQLLHESQYAVIECNPVRCVSGFCDIIG